MECSNSENRASKFYKYSSCRNSLSDVWHVHFQTKVKFDQNFSIFQSKKNLQKSTILKMSSKVILRYNNSENLLTN